MEYLNKEISQAIITLGGKGKRLNDITLNTPKPLFPVLGKHSLERAIEALNGQGINRFIWLLGYKEEIFQKEALDLRKKFDITIELYIEENPKGEAGSLINVLSDLDEFFIFINGDIIFDLNFNKLINFHFKNDADITLVTHLTNHPEDSDCIIENPSLSIYKYKLKTEKNISQGFYLGFAGISILNKKIVKSVKYSNNCSEFLSIFKDFIIFANQKGFKVFSYNTSEYLKDMGTPKRFLATEKDLKAGKLYEKSYLNKQKVLFIDRDNTIIKCNEGEYIIDYNFELLEENIKKLAQLSKEFSFVTLISNQPQISMGKVSWQKVIEINGEIIKQCQKLGLDISCFYMCPHHPHNGFANEIKELKINCFCRKPSPGLFLEAAFERNINLKESYMVGDSWRDEVSAQSCDVKFIDIRFLKYNQKIRD